MPFEDTAETNMPAALDAHIHAALDEFRRRAIEGTPTLAAFDPLAFWLSDSSGSPSALAESRLEEAFASEPGFPGTTLVQKISQLEEWLAYDGADGVFLPTDRAQMIYRVLKKWSDVRRVAA